MGRYCCRTAQYTLYSAFLERPYPDTGVIAGSSEATIVWAEAYATNCFSGIGSLPRCQVIHIGLKVLDDTTLVSGRHIMPRMRKCKGAYRTIVCLENCFKVERESVPKCEFATGGSGENTASFWCPLRDCWCFEIEEGVGHEPSRR